MEELPQAATPDFTQSMKQLFKDLQQRGSVPLFPNSWCLHFIYMPQSLFCTTTQPPIISSLLEDKADDFRAKLAFERLALLGGRVRDSMEASSNRSISFAAQYLIEAECKHYLDWAFKVPRRMNMDVVPLIAIVTARKSQWSGDVHEDCARRCEFILKDMKSAVQESAEAGLGDTCYGIAISGPIVALVALSCLAKGALVKTLHVCDFSNPDGDVWDAIALALHIIHARNEHYKRIQQSQTYSLYTLGDQFHANIHIR